MTYYNNYYTFWANLPPAGLCFSDNLSILEVPLVVELLPITAVVHTLSLFGG